MFKHMYDKKRALASFQHRMQMCKIAFEKFSVLPSCRVIVKPLERSVCLRRLRADPSARSGTADILDQLRVSYPKITFSFALGADTYKDLARGKWRRSGDLAKFLDNRFEVFARGAPGGEGAAEVESLMAEQNDLADRCRRDKEKITSFGGRVHFIQGTEEASAKFALQRMGISSTAVRAQLRTLGDDEGGVVGPESPLRAPALIDPGVLAFARSEGLFGPSWVPPAPEEDAAILEAAAAAPKEIPHSLCDS